MHPDIDVIFGVNDELGAAGGVGSLPGCGARRETAAGGVLWPEGSKARDALREGGPFRASIAMFPEVVGRACIDAATCAYHRCACRRTS